MSNIKLTSEKQQSGKTVYNSGIIQNIVEIAVLEVEGTVPVEEKKKGISLYIEKDGGKGVLALKFYSLWFPPWKIPHHLELLYLDLYKIQTVHVVPSNLSIHPLSYSEDLGYKSFMLYVVTFWGND